MKALWNKCKEWVGFVFSWLCVLFVVAFIINSVLLSVLLLLKVVSC